MAPTSPPSLSVRGSSAGPAPASASITCDQCRVRKVRCLPGSVSPGSTGSRGTSPSGLPTRPCQSCQRRGQQCTFEYSRKRPGRPRGRKTMRPSSSSDNRSVASPHAMSGTARTHPSPGPTTESSAQNDLLRGGAGATSFLGTPPAGSSSPTSTMRPGAQPADMPVAGSSRVDIDMTPLSLPLLDGLGRGTGSAINAGAGVDGLPGVENAQLSLNWGSSGAGGLFADDCSPLATALMGTSAFLDGGGSSGGARGGSMGITDMDMDLLPFAGVSPHNTVVSGDGKTSSGALPAATSIEAVVAWEMVGQFLSLYLRTQHVLVPLVHKPTFAQDVLHRRDRYDEAFRGLLFSMVAYTICNCPISLLPASLSRPQLQSLLRRCLRASRIIQVRHQAKPNELVLASTIIDWISSQATGSIELGHNLMSDMRKLVYLLGLNHAVPREGMNILDREVCRRIYWEAYAIDKTNALNGHPMSLHDAEGVPPLPLDLNDEQITSETTLAPPAGRVSTLTGFIAVSRLFRLLSGCLWRRKTLQSDPEAGPSRESILAWTARATEDLHALLDSLPPQLRAPIEPDRAESGDQSSRTSTPFATQAANISITALCVEFAIIDLRSMVVPERNTAEDRKSTALRAFKELQSIPVESLASNGESMRGKVLRILSVLHTVENPPEDLDAHIWDWWDMYSRVHFLQVIPDRPASAVPTCPPSPAAARDQDGR